MEGPRIRGRDRVVLLAVGVGIFEYSYHPAQPELKSIAALATSLPPEQAVTLPSLNINYVDVVSSQANELDEMGAVDDSVQQAVVSALWNSISDSTISVDAVDYLGNSFSN